MSKAQVLVIEDDDDIRELVRYNLHKEGYDVECVGSGEDGLRSAQWAVPDLVILDLMLPGMDGFEVCKALRKGEKTSSLPVIMLTAKGEEPDVVTGLELGADDYITKPFSPRVLLARIKSILRRQEQSKPADPEEKVLRFEKLTIHPGRHEVVVNDETVDLTFTEFRILQLLARRPGWVFSRNDIVESIHGDSYPVTDRSVDVQISGLRKKLRSAGEYIETVRGIGYRFRD